MGRFLFALVAPVLVLCGCGPAKDERVVTSRKAEPAAAWQTVAAGVELGTFPAPGNDTAQMQVVRIDPTKVELVLLSAAAENHEPLTADAWAKRYGLIAVTNAGMFDVDHATHVGYMKRGDEIRPAEVRKDYSSAVAFSPTGAGDPAFRMFDLDEFDVAKDVAPRFRFVIQNLRLIKRSGENRWQQQPKQWSEAALGEDKEGRVLLLFSRAPASMHDFNDHVLGLPIDLVCAQHLEGGPEASLYLSAGGVEIKAMGSYETGFTENDDNHEFWPLPNVIGIRVRK